MKIYYMKKFIVYFKKMTFLIYLFKLLKNLFCKMKFNVFIFNLEIPIFILKELLRIN